MTTDLKLPKNRAARKICERCLCAGAVSGNRYCKTCGKQVRDELRSSGWLQEEERGPGIFSEERGRKGFRSTQVLGGEPI